MSRLADEFVLATTEDFHIKMNVVLYFKNQDNTIIL